MGTRPRFEITITINELTNLPHVSGYSWVRWYIKESAKPDARGRTKKYPVSDHRVVYNHKSHFQYRFRLSKDTTLKPCVAIFDVLWEHVNSDRMTLGKVEVNLSEYINQEPQTNRFLLRESKINGTLSLTIESKQVSGTKNFKVYV